MKEVVGFFTTSRAVRCSNAIEQGKAVAWSQLLLNSLTIIRRDCSIAEFPKVMKSISLVEKRDGDNDQSAVYYQATLLNHPHKSRMDKL